MSMLENQVYSLRLMARLVRDYDYKEISQMLREAADTIESLRDKLQAVRETCEMIDREEVPKPRPCRKCGEAPQVLATGIRSLDGREFGFIFECGCGSTAFDDAGSYTKAVEMWNEEADKW